jgi:hypothetical protein
MATSEIARYELDTLTPFQTDIHFTEEGERISSIVFHKYRKSTWFTTLPVLLEHSGNANDGQIITYTVNPTFHHLMYTSMRIKWPAIRVKEKKRQEIQICWPHNLGTAPVMEANFKHNDLTLQSMDKIWFDIFPQFFMMPGFRENHNIGIGNLPCLERWTDEDWDGQTGEQPTGELPGFWTNVDQPWYYSMTTGLAFPIWRCEKTQAKITHTYTFRLKVGELLRMRKKVKGVWKEIPVNFNYLEGVHSQSRIPIPELWGRYCYNSKAELEYHSCKNQNPVLYIHNVENGIHQNPNTFGETAVIPLHSNTPALAMFWVAENLKASGNRNFSNYTSCTDNLYKGWNPCSKVTMMYGSNVRFKDMDSDHFSIAEARKHFISPPSEPGYNGYSFANRCSNLDSAEVGVTFSGLNAALKIEIKDTDIFKIPIEKEIGKRGGDDEGDEGDEDDHSEEVAAPRASKKGSSKFTIHVRLLTLRRLSIITDKEGLTKFSLT